MADVTPPAVGSDGSSYMSFLGDAFKEFQAAGNQIASAVGGGGQGLATATAGANEVATGQQTVNLATEQAAMKLKADNLEAANRFGLTPGAPSAMVAAMSKSIADNETSIMQMDENIKGKLAVGFLDDPLQWVINQVALPFDIQQRNESADQTKQQLSVLQELAGRTEDQYKINAVVDTAASEERLGGLNAIAAGQAKMAIAESQFKAAQLGLQAASIKESVNSSQFSAAIALNSAQTQARQLDLEEKGLYLKTQELDISKEKLVIDKINSTIIQNREAREQLAAPYNLDIQKLTSENMQERQDAMTALQGRLNTVTASYGLNLIKYQELAIMGDGPMKKLLEEGMINPDVQSGRLGFDAVTALQNANTNNLPLTSTQNILRSYLIKVEDAARQKAGGDYVWKTLGPDVQHARLQQEIQLDFNKQASSIPDTGGPFSPPSLKATLSLSPVVTNLSLSKDLAPLALSDPQHPTSANEVMAAAGLKIKNGEATPAQMAQEITTMYQAVVDKNNQLYQYQKFALPPQTNFKTVINPSGGWANNMNVDMTNRAAVESMLIRAFIKDSVPDINKSLTTTGMGVP